MNDSVIVTKDLATHIIVLHKKIRKKEITPIKLQKTLYFLFAYWGKNVYSHEDDFSEVKEQRSSYLFGDKIEAWHYGPVVPAIYRDFENLLLSSEKLHDFGEDDFLKSFVDDYCKKLFKISDFELVDISHSDDCWKKAYERGTGWSGNLN